MNARELFYTFPTDPLAGGDNAMSRQWSEGLQPFGRRQEVRANEELRTLRIQPNALSAEECRTVIALGEARPRMAGRADIVPGHYRASHIAWIEPQPEVQWLFHRVGMLFAMANRYYGFELIGMLDPIQYTSYGPGEHFDWHMDLGSGQTSTRKLSLTIQLSERDEYEGGILEVVATSMSPESRRLGAAVFFPAFVAHRVSPVSSGLRRSLVAWACGHAFR